MITLYITFTMSGIINYIISWFKGTKTNEPNDKLTVKGIQQDAKKQNIDNIKPFNYEESTELNLDQMMLNDSMKSDFNDLSLNTAIDSSVNEKETESDNQTITDSDIEEVNNSNNLNNNSNNLNKANDQFIADVSETERMINRIITNMDNKQTGGNYRTKYNRSNYIMNGGSNEYCGKVNKQIYDSHKVDIGGY